MIAMAAQTPVFVFRSAVDMRKSYDTLSGIVSHFLKQEILQGAAFVFVGKNRKRLKVLWWDGTGLCLLQKRLSKGHFIAPWKCGEGDSLKLSPTELNLLIEGCDRVGHESLSPESWQPPTQPRTFR